MLCPMVQSMPTHGPDGSEILSVGDFTRRVKSAIESAVPRCWVRGEVSNLTNHGNGHVYFSLKDARAQVSCVLFRQDALRLKAPLRAGQEVIALGEPSLYEPQGRYQLICRVVAPVGEGELQRRYEALKARLDAEGLFAPERKRPLPQWPRRIAVVTSPTGAAIADFISILSRRGYRGQLLLIPSRVQGDEAAGEIVAAITLAQTEAFAALRGGAPDLLVAMRGGGSLEDLWPFNEEAVARALAACSIPTISAVGHQIDFSLSDFAADVRAETPSGAAELIAAGFQALCVRREAVAARLGREVSRHLRSATAQVQYAAQGVRSAHPRRIVEQRWQQLDELESRLRSSAALRLSHLSAALGAAAGELRPRRLGERTQVLSQRIAHLEHRLQRATAAAVPPLAQRLQNLATRLSGVTLAQTLARGYALVRDAQGQVVSRKAALKPGDLLSVDFADGEVVVRVEQV